MKQTLRGLLLAGATLFSWAAQALAIDRSEPEPLLTIGFEKPKRAVSRVFLHCTASDHAHHDNAETLRKWHVEHRGWSDIGYHYLIKFDGTVIPCRPLERTPAAQMGHNKGTIAIALSGGQNGKRDAFTAKQFHALNSLCHEINDAYSGKLTFHGHSEVAPGRACPVYEYKNLLRLNGNGQITGV